MMCRFIMACLLPFLLFAACSGDQTIIIGYLGSLNGLDSQLGVQGRNGCELAVFDINKSGGINGKMIRLLVRDIGSNSSQALDAIADLKKNHVVAIIAQCTSSQLENVYYYINSNQIVLLTPSASSSVFKNEKDYFFRIFLRTEDEIKMLSATAIQRLKLNKMACVFDRNNSQYTEEFYIGFKTAFENGGGTITLSKGFSSGNKDEIRAITSAIVNKGKDIQAVFIAASSMDVAMFCHLLAHDRSYIPILSEKWACNKSLILNSGKSLERYYLTSEYDMDSTNLPMVIFNKSFYMYYHIQPENLNASAYEATTVLAEAISRCAAVDPESLRNALSDQKPFSGLHSTILFNTNGEAYRSIIVFRIIDGKFRRIYP